MRSPLTTKLVLAFLFVALITAAFVAVLASRSTSAGFDQYVINQTRDSFISQAASYYQTYGSWENVNEYLPKALKTDPPQPGGQAPPLPPFALADQNGIIVVSAGPYRVGNLAQASELKQGSSVTVDGQVVGTVIYVADLQGRSSDQQRYIHQVQQTLLQAVGGAVIVALLLGIWLARTLTRTLRELTEATDAVSQGDLDHQVPVRSKDELGKLALSFNQMSAKLAESNQLRRQMTADIAHELRSPLTVIQGYTEALRDGALPPVPETFETMYKESALLGRLIEDLRTLALADAGELKMECRPIQPQELLDRVMTSYLHLAHQKEIELKIDQGADLKAVTMDPDRMTQVLGNLVANALRYTPPGGHIQLSAHQKEGWLQLRVQDDGNGIAPESLSRIFDRFYRADASRQQETGEVGLGLAIARSIVELHGGKIQVESELGRGTGFIIDLPAV